MSARRKSTAKAPKKQGKSNLQRARERMYRELILETAERLFAERGFDETRMQEVAGEAGISLGTLYGCFPGKAELFRAIHESRAQRLIESVAELRIEGRSALETLLDGVETYTRFLLDQPNYLRMHLLDGHSWAMGERFEHRELTEAWIRGTGLTAETFRRGIAEGSFHRDDPELMARTMFAMQQIRLADWVEKGEKTPPEELIAQMQTQVVRAFCRPEVIEARETDERALPPSSPASPTA